MVIVDIRPPEVNGGSALGPPSFTILGIESTINPEQIARFSESSSYSVHLLHHSLFQIVLRFQLEGLPDVRPGQRFNVEYLVPLLEHAHRPG